MKKLAFGAALAGALLLSQDLAMAQAPSGKVTIVTSFEIGRAHV